MYVYIYIYIIISKRESAVYIIISKRESAVVNLRNTFYIINEHITLTIAKISSPIVINMPTRGLLADETKGSFVRW